MSSNQLKSWWSIFEIRYCSSNLLVRVYYKRSAQFQIVGRLMAPYPTHKTNHFGPPSIWHLEILIILHRQNFILEIMYTVFSLYEYNIFSVRNTDMIFSLYQIVEWKDSLLWKNYKFHLEYSTFNNIFLKIYIFWLIYTCITQIMPLQVS